MAMRFEDLYTILNTPLSERGIPEFWVYVLAVIGGIYLLNPGAGLIELIPDNLPLIGNLDEGGACLAVWYGILQYMERKKRKKTT